MDCAFLHAKSLGEVVLNKLVMHDAITQGLSQTQGHVFAERSHLTRHCDDSH